LFSSKTEWRKAMTVGALGAVRQKIGEIDLFLLPSQK